jgi:hypothetical protein
MEIFISIDGVLRNTIAKFDYHYKDYYLDSEPEEKTEEENRFEYGVIEPVKNNFLLESYKFQSKEEFDNFTFIDYSVEIFGHSNPSYQNVFFELNNLIYQNKEHNFTLVGLDQLGKSKPSTLFFLSKNGFMGNNVKFTMSSEIQNLWKKCDLWITDSQPIIDSVPKNKKVVKFNTDYNQHFTNSLEIHKLTEIDKTWLKSSENIIISTLTKLLNVAK